MKPTSGLRRVVSNASWIVTDRLIRLGVGFFVGVWVARSLGPSGYGTLSFGLAWTALFASAAKLGLDEIVVRELVARPESASRTLGSAAALRVTGAVTVVVISLLAYLAFYGGADREQLLVVVLVGSANLFLTSDVIDWWLRSRVEWRFAFRARVLAFALSTAAKVTLLAVGAGVVWIASVTLVDAAFLAVFYTVELLRHPSRVKQWKPTWTRARELLSDSWPAIISSLAVMIYMRIDQIMIEAMMGDSDVGIYSAAVRLSEVWYVIPVAISSSLTPRVVNARSRGLVQYHRSLIGLIAFLFWVSVAVALVVTMLGPQVLVLLFGPAYQAAGPVLQVHFWAGVFVAMGVAISRWFLAENRLRVSLYRSLAGMAVNVCLNLILIPAIGLVGAALATILSQFVQVYLSTALFKQSRPAWRLINKSIVYPFRFLRKRR